MFSSTCRIRLYFGDECTGSYLFTKAGVYTIHVTITDKYGASGSAERIVVMYDPSAGFVTGGGWIDSPVGAYKPDASLAGKATFGFVSKYQKGATVPEGNTQFVFHAGNLNFHSKTYQWLVVSGGKFQYKGVGTINGAWETSASCCLRRMPNRPRMLAMSTCSASRSGTRTMVIRSFTTTASSRGWAADRS